MTCKDCPNRKEIDAVEQMEGAPEWVCGKKHTECEDVICLLRMIIWSISNLDIGEEEDGL